MRTLLAVNRAVLCALMFLLFFVVFLEIAVRFLFRVSLNISWEISSYLMAAVFFMGCAQAIWERAHISVEVPLPMGRRPALVLAVVRHAVVFTALAAILYAVSIDIWRDWVLRIKSDTVLQVPLYLAKAPMVLGIALSLATTTWSGIEAVRKAVEHA